MILRLVDAINNSPSQLKLPPTTSMVRISTTRPTFLLFETESIEPSYVAKVGPESEMKFLHDTLEKLYGRIPFLIPKPIATISCHKKIWLHVQEACHGLPWFTLQKHLSGENWITLRKHSIDALHTLHNAVAANPEWQTSVHPGNELRQELHEIKSTIDLPESSEERIMQGAKRLDNLGAIRWYWQHGDFCLNNLLVRGNQLRIIDFEEFGQTAVPLQDELTLAQSFDEIMPPTKETEALKDHIKLCVAQTIQGCPRLHDFEGPLLIYNLIQRINQCTGKSRRMDNSRALLLKLNALLQSDPSLWSMD